jgi:hypothetical protein
MDKVQTGHERSSESLETERRETGVMRPVHFTIVREVDWVGVASTPPSPPSNWTSRRRSAGRVIGVRKEAARAQVCSCSSFRMRKCLLRQEPQM